MGTLHVQLHFMTHVEHNCQSMWEGNSLNILLKKLNICFMLSKYLPRVYSFLR